MSEDTVESAVVEAQPRRRLWPRLVVLIVAVVIVAGFAWRWTRPQPVLVTVAEIGTGVVESTAANTRAGTIHAHRRARLSPAIGGQVAGLFVTEGDRVKTDQTLLQLWNEDLAADLELARREHIRAMALADETCQRAGLAKREAARLADLAAKELTAPERVDRADTEAKALEAACRAARSHAEAQQARITRVDAALGRTVLKAPFAGVVAEVNAEIGEFVTPSPTGIPTPPTVDLIDDRSLYVKAPIDEVDAPAVRTGMVVRITLDAFGERVFKGKVRRIAPYVLDREKQARTVDVEVDFVELPPEVAMLAGYSADVEIVLDRRENVLRVPTEAVLEGDRVLVFDAALGALVERRIEPGRSNWQFTEVNGGLTAGERVVMTIDRAGVVAGAVAQLETAETR